MAILTLAEAKEAARVEHDDEDLLMQAYADAAAAWIVRVTGTDFDESAPEDVKQAARMLVAHWARFRGAASEINPVEVPLGVKAMLATHRSFAHGRV